MELHPEERKDSRNLGALQSVMRCCWVDMVKDEPTLVAAYDDRDGVTAEFNLKCCIASIASLTLILISRGSAIALSGIP